MTESILCCVSFCLLMWIIYLKIEISELKKNIPQSSPPNQEDDDKLYARRGGVTKGMRTFRID